MSVFNHDWRVSPPFLAYGCSSTNSERPNQMNNQSSRAEANWSLAKCGRKIPMSRKNGCSPNWRHIIQWLFVMIIRKVKKTNNKVNPKVVKTSYYYKTWTPISRHLEMIKLFQIFFLLLAHHKNLNVWLMNQCKLHPQSMM